jgi:ABC-type nitrate/sulfonate/bicarbonate transport system substrate-binding protein
MLRNRTFRWLLALTAALSLVAAACGDDDDDDSGGSDTTAAAGGSETTAAGATTAGGAAGAATDPCDESKAPASLTSVKLQLDWTPNTNHTGFFVADELGCYAEAGLELEILPYSGGNADEIVSSGQADFGITFHNSLALAGPAGVPVVAVAAILQKTAEAIAVKADRADIASPKDLDGKTYAGFGGPQEEPVLKAIIQADGGKGEFEVVTLQTSAYEAVYSGAADFTIPFVLWEGIEATLENEPVKYFEYSDYGLPNQYSVLLETSQDNITGKADMVRSFLAASEKGWQYAVSNPQEAGQLMIDANPGVFENTELVFESAKAMSEGGYLVDASGKWGTIDPAVFAAYNDFLLEAGIIADQDGTTLTTSPDWSSYIDTSLLPA